MVKLPLRKKGSTMLRPTTLSIILIFAGVASLDGHLAAQSELESKTRPSQERVEIMLLGVYHFNNPGADEFNNTIDDYYSPQRQAELHEVVDLLAMFEPEKVLVEVLPESQTWIDEQYEAFRAQTLQLEDLANGRSETFQLGFRIAHALDHEKVYCIDARGIWLGSSVREVAERNQNELYASHQANSAARVAAVDVVFREHTVRENLILMNRMESILENHDYYNRVAVDIVDMEHPSGIPTMTQTVDGTEIFFTGIDGRHIGAELVGEWYKRNLKIYSNILQLTSAEDRRLLLIMGQGHIRTLRHFFKDHPGFDVVDANDFLE